MDLINVGAAIMTFLGHGRLLIDVDDFQVELPGQILVKSGAQILHRL